MSVARGRIASIELFGYQGIDLEAVRHVLRFREGDEVSRTLTEQAHSAVKRDRGTGLLACRAASTMAIRSFQRAMAADALGYGARTARQMASLVHAARDADPGVRHNATRALMEILRADPSAATRVPPDTFIDMLRSGTWSDRNKVSGVVRTLTQPRDPRLLARLMTEATEAFQLE